MMRFTTRFLMTVLGGAFLCASAPAALHATLPDDSGGRPWEMLAAEFPPVPGDVDISVQDARGGPEFVRRVPGNAGRAWLPLPLVAPSDIPGSATGAWPVVVTLRSSGRILDQSRLQLSLGHGSPSESGPRLASTAPLPGFAGVCVILPDQEILTAPALLFAGCDFVFLPPDLQSRITRERALELLAVGTRLAAPADPSAGPPGSSGSGALGELLWERSSLGPNLTAWITAVQPVPPPAPIEPGLGQSAGGALHQVVPTAVTTALLLLGPLAIGLLVLQRGLFHRRRTVLTASLLAMTILTGALVLYLRVHSSTQELLSQWRQSAASPDKSAAGLALEERLERCTALFGTTVDFPADGPRTLFPVATTTAQYWALRGVQWRFDGSTHLTGTLPPRTTLCWETRAADVPTMLPAYPRTPDDRARLWSALRVTPADARWLLDGYVKPADSPDEPGLLLTTWAADQPWAAGGKPSGSPHTMPWYDLRFAPGHRYLLWPRAGILNVVDFGPSEPSAPESRPIP